jgi:hypothetical protein
MAKRLGPDVPETTSGKWCVPVVLVCVKEEDEVVVVPTVIRSAEERVACRGRRKNKEDEEAPLLILEAIDPNEP